MHEIPEWLKLELAANHPGIEVRWMPYGEGKNFVIPVTGDAFHRMPVRKLAGHILYRRHIAADTAMKWKLHPLTYFPDGECVTDGRFVVFQTNVVTGHVSKVFDCVNDDGSLHPLDRRVLDGILIRDGKYGAHDKAIKDVESGPERAEKVAVGNLEESVGDLWERIHYDVKKSLAGENACVTPDDDEDSALEG